MCAYYVGIHVVIHICKHMRIISYHTVLYLQGDDERLQIQRVAWSCIGVCWRVSYCVGACFCLLLRCLLLTNNMKRVCVVLGLCMYG